MPPAHNTLPEEEQSPQKPAMTAQQKQLSESARSPLRAYKQLVIGESGYGALLSFELYNLLFCGMPGLLGYGFRKGLLPRFLKSGGKGLMLGKGVSFRQPGAMSMGQGVFIEDRAALDVRLGEEGGSEAGIEFASHVFVGRDSIVSAKGGFIKLSDGCNISSNCRIATQSRIEIGKSVLIAAYVYIGPGNHQMQQSDVPLIERPMAIKGGVSIGDHAWIGTRSTILDGVSIGREAIIGAHSLVTEDVPERAIAAGTPAKVLRFRED